MRKSFKLILTSQNLKRSAFLVLQKIIALNQDKDK